MNIELKAGTAREPALFPGIIICRWRHTRFYAAMDGSGVYPWLRTIAAAEALSVETANRARVARPAAQEANPGGASRARRSETSVGEARAARWPCSNEVPRPDITLPPHGCGDGKCPSGHGQYPIVRSRAQGAAHCRAAGVWEPFSSSWRVCVYGWSTWGAALEGGERFIIEDVTDHAMFAGTPVLEVMLDAGARAVQSTRLD
jgi:hypothetical protein